LSQRRIATVQSARIAKDAEKNKRGPGERKNNAHHVLEVLSRVGGMPGRRRGGGGYLQGDGQYTIYRERDDGWEDPYSDPFGRSAELIGRSALEKKKPTTSPVERQRL